jgi:hypothetical protein
VGTGGPFPGAKAWPGRDADHSPYLVPRLGMSKSCTPLPPSASMACSGTALLFTAHISVNVATSLSCESDTIKHFIYKAVPQHTYWGVGGRGGRFPPHSLPRHLMGVVSVTPRPPFTPGERTPGTHFTGGWVGPRADTEVRGKILLPLLGIEPQSPRLPVRNQALWWATPAPIFYTCYCEITKLQYDLFSSCLK